MLLELFVKLIDFLFDLCLNQFSPITVIVLNWVSDAMR